MSDWFDRLTADGYVVLPAVLTSAEVDIARRDCETALAAPAAADSLLIRNGGRPHGARNVVRLWPGVVALSRRPRLADALGRVLGPAGGLVRGLYFDKPPGDSWALPWHRDTAVAVATAGPTGVFTKPTVKAGVPHVEAPVDLLATMITARIHLDDVTDRNGPLRVVPGSHADGPTATGHGRAAVNIHGRAGDVLLMRPRLLHASGHCDPECVGHRRVVHLEFAPTPDLPDGYAWHDFVPIATE